MLSRATNGLRSSFGCLACAATIVWSDVADARGAAQLEFVQQVEDHRCPDEAELRRRVGAQLGYDPFDTTAPTRIEATIERKARRLHGRVVIRRGEETLGERELEPTKDCEALVSALALTISVAIDPIHVARDPAPRTVPADAAPATEVTRPEAPTTAQPSDPSEPGAEAAHTSTTSTPASTPTGPSRAALRLTVAPMVSIGVAPAVAPGLTASAGVGWPNLSLALEGRLDLPASARLSIGGDVATSVALATLVPCVHVARWMGCVLGSVGSMRAASSGISDPAIDDSVFAAVGVRAGIEVPLSRIFAVRPQIEGQAALTRPSLELNGKTIWTTPPLAAAIGLAIVARFGATAPL